MTTPAASLLRSHEHPRGSRTLLAVGSIEKPDRPTSRADRVDAKKLPPRIEPRRLDPDARRRTPRRARGGPAVCHTRIRNCPAPRSSRRFDTEQEQLAVQAVSQLRQPHLPQVGLALARQRCGGTHDLPTLEAHRIPGQRPALQRRARRLRECGGTPRVDDFPRTRQPRGT